MITEALKEKTDGHHREIETVTRFRRVFAPDYALSEYQDLLKRFYGFHTPLEQTFLSHAEWLDGFELQPRLRSPHLVADLKALGVSEEELQQLPQCSDLPQLDTPAKLFGCLYVLEGSTLGGQMISKHLNERFSFPPGQEAVTFYSGHGKETMPMWKAFKESLNQRFSTEQDLKELSSAAGETFEALARWMNQ
jgi:heme oxygenase